MMTANTERCLSIGCFLVFSKNVPHDFLSHASHFWEDAILGVHLPGSRAEQGDQFEKAGMGGSFH